MRMRNNWFYGKGGMGVRGTWEVELSCGVGNGLPAPPAPAVRPVSGKTSCCSRLPEAPRQHEGHPAQGRPPMRPGAGVPPLRVCRTRQGLTHRAVPLCAMSPRALRLKLGHPANPAHLHLVIPRLQKGPFSHPFISSAALKAFYCPHSSQTVAFLQPASGGESRVCLRRL